MSAAGAIRAGAAYVEVFLESNRVTQGLAAVQAKIRGWSASLSRLGSSSYGGELPEPFAAIARFASSPAGMFAGLLSAAKMAASGGNAMQSLAERAGTSVEAISSLAYAARRSDVAVESLAAGIRKMQVNIADAARSGKTSQEVLAALGLTAGQLQNLLPEEQFKRVADRIAAIKNPTERAAAAVKIFGRNGTDLLPLLMQGSDGIGRWEARARALGITLSGEAAEGARRFSLLLGDLTDVLRSGVAVIGGAMLPYLDSMVNRIIRIVTTVRDWIKEHRGLVVVLLQVTGAIVAGGLALTVFSAILRNIAGGIGILLGVIHLLGSTVVMVGSVLATTWSGVVAAIGAVGAAFAALSTAQIFAFAAIWAGIGAILYFTAALGNTISGVAAAFRSLASDLMATFGAIGDALSAGDIALAAKVLWAMLKMEWQKGVNWLTETWIGFKEIFVGTWTDAVYNIARIMTSGWAILQQGWNGLVTGMSAAWTIFTDSVVSGWSSASNWISKRWIDLMALLGQYDPQTAEGAKKILDEDFNRASQARQQETQQKLAATGQSFEDRKNEIEQERTGALKNLEDERNAKHRARQEQYASDLKASQDAVDAARKEWDDARAEATQARAAMNAPDLPGRAAQKIPDISANLAAAKASVVGTFSGAAISGLGTGEGIQEKMENHLAEIKTTQGKLVEVNQKILDQMANGIMLA
jgi:hypothetical protein